MPSPSSAFLRQIWNPRILPIASSAICWLAHQLLAVVPSGTPWPLSTFTDITADCCT